MIGAGAAGASAAFRLQSAGVSVRMFERDSRVGGRTRTERVDGFVVDVGAGLLPGTYKAVYRLMQDSGQQDMLEPMLSPTAVIRGGRLHYIELSSMAGSFLKTELLGPSSKLLMGKVGFRIARMWSALGFEDLSSAAPYDTESVAEYALRSLSQELYDYLMNPLQKIMYVIPGSQASIVDFFWSVKNLMSPTAFCLRGGMDQLVSNVTSRIPVSLGMEAISVTEIADKVEVRLRNVEGAEVVETADTCVIATPARQVPKIDRGLSEPARQYLSNLRYSCLTDLHLRLKRPPDERAVLIMVPDEVDTDLGGILLDHNKGSDRAPTGKGALSAYFVDGWSRIAAGWSDEEVYMRGLEKIERVMPGIGNLVEGYHVQRWDYGSTASYPGYYKELAEFTKSLNVARRVQLAGDYFSIASVNTAVTSGEIAAQRLLKRYLGVASAT